MPAQSPTLSPTLSAMVAGLRGSSSGMPASTLPTRSAPTSAALVKMPPPTRKNSASSEPPNAKPTSMIEAEFWNAMMMMVAPNRPRPAVNRPATLPVRNATCSAPPKSLRRAAAAVRTLPRTATHMPKNPMKPEATHPKMKVTVRMRPDDVKLRTSLPVVSMTAAEVANTTTARITTITAMVRNCRLR